MQAAARKAVESIKETAANIGASAKSGLEKTKATLQEKSEMMSAQDQSEKDMATRRKEEKISQAEMDKQQAHQYNAAAKQSAVAALMTQGPQDTTGPGTETATIDIAGPTTQTATTYNTTGSGPESVPYSNTGHGTETATSYTASGLGHDNAISTSTGPGNESTTYTTSGPGHDHANKRGNYK